MLTSPVSHHVSDMALASRAAAGDQAAFASLYRRHHPHVLRYCRRLLRCPEDAADAAQQTFLNMHCVLAKGTAPEQSVGGYLLRVAQRASFDLHERRKAQQALAQRDRLCGHAATAQPDHATAIIAAHAIRRATAKLPERHRAVLAMRELEDLTYEEIGARLDMNENAVAQLLHRARKRLAQELALERAHPATPLAG